MGVPIASSSGLLSGGDNFLSSAAVTPSKHVATVIRPHGFAGAPSSSGSLPHAFTSVAPQRPLVPHGGRPSRSDSSVAEVCGSGSLVASGGEVGVWYSSPGFSPIPVVVYRRISVRLGSRPVGSDGLGSVIKGRKFDAHQCARDTGRVSSSGCVSAPAVGSVSS